MAVRKTPPPKVRGGISSKDLAADAPDAEKVPLRPDPDQDPRSMEQRIMGKWPVNNF